MPRPAINDYTFYKIININGDIDLSYVGSTANFKQRNKGHKSACNNENDKAHHSKVYQTIREHGGWCEFKMVEVGYAKQLTSTQARVIEERYRVELKAELNSRKCFRTDQEKKEKRKEYHEVNREKLNENRKGLYEKNKVKILEQRKEYGQRNKEKIAESKKEYREVNREKISEQRKEKYQQNKEQILERNKEKITCECGCIVTKGCLTKHKRSQKHIDFINKGG